MWFHRGVWRLIGICLIVAAPSWGADAVRASLDGCMCGDHAELVAAADSVLVGTPIEVELEVAGPAGTEALRSLRVDDRITGPDAPELNASGGGSLGDCWAELVAGAPMGIVAFWRDGHLAPSRCGVAAPAVLKATVLIEDDDRTNVLISVALGATPVAVVVAGGLIWRQRRR